MINDNKVITLNSKGVPGTHGIIFLENCASRTNLNIITLSKVATIAPIAENLNIFTVINQEKQNIRVSGHEIIESKPRKDATPFPPLNFNQTGNI